MKKLVIIPALFILAGCMPGFLPDVAKVVDSIEDTAICVEINKDAMMEDQDIHINVDLIQKNPKVAQA